MAKLSHVDRGGKARMVDVSPKKRTARRALARGSVRLSQEAFEQVRRNAAEKGDVLTVAQVAGIQAAKRTSELIPLCHPLPLDQIRVTVSLDESRSRILLEAVVKTRSTTGVEMEALTAVAVAGLTVYDMVKAIDREATVTEICLVEKSGGRSGRFRRSGRK